MVGENGFLRRAIAEDRVPSLILWGPPGVGKTTLARLIAAQTSSLFLSYSAVSTGVREMREVLEQARTLRQRHGKRTILFLDEIHRFNRSQQDVFLLRRVRRHRPRRGDDREPSFDSTARLLSRCKVVVLEPPKPEAIVRIVERALGDGARASEPATSAWTIRPSPSSPRRPAATRGARSISSRRPPPTPRPTRSRSSKSPGCRSSSSARSCSTTRRGRSTTT